jgi:hypothetical protein
MYTKEPIDWTTDGPVGLGAGLELEFKMGFALEMVMEATMELVTMTEDRLADGAKVELGPGTVEETKDVKLRDNWYKLSPFGPPQISRLFALQAILPIR